MFLKGLAEELKRAVNKSIDLGMESMSVSMEEFTKSYQTLADMKDMPEGETTKTVVETFSDGTMTKTVTRTVTTVVVKTYSETSPEVNPRDKERKKDE